MGACVRVCVSTVGICRGEPLTDMGKRLQLFKILSLTLLPILGLWAFTVYSLSDSIEGKSDIEQVTMATTAWPVLLSFAESFYNVICSFIEN